MVVIGILAGVTLGALNAAREAGRAVKTKATIAKIDRFVMAKYESYRTRRLPINTRNLRPKVVAAMKLLAMRDLIRMEMPERLRDVTDAPLTGSTLQKDWPDADTYSDLTTAYGSGIQRPALLRAYQRRFSAPGASAPHDSAECLYMIVTIGNPEARSQFSESEVGDTDSDGLPEFHDAWGNPILFLRWAPAFTESDIQSNDADKDHDPFDPYRLELDTSTVPPRGARLVPLICSAGPNGSYGIETAQDYRFSGSPYRFAPTSSSTVLNQAGTLSGNDHFDNIHNHRLEVK
jgi:hypothetical protein